MPPGPALAEIHGLPHPLSPGLRRRVRNVDRRTASHEGEPADNSHLSAPHRVDSLNSFVLYGLLEVRIDSPRRLSLLELSVVRSAQHQNVCGTLSSVHGHRFIISRLLFSVAAEGSVAIGT